MFGTMRRLAVGSLMSVTIGASLLGTAAPTAAAVYGMGTGYQALVDCDSMYGKISIQAKASAAPTFNNGQWIRYRYWIIDETTRTNVPGLSPTNFGQFQHIRNHSNGAISFQEPHALSGVSYFVLTRGHAYSVWTDYQFWTGWQWVDAGYIRTTWYFNMNSGNTGYCFM